MESDRGWKELFLIEVNRLGWAFGEREWKALETYWEALIRANREVNLTSITDREEGFWKHFYDSLAVAVWPGLPESGRIIDVGTGAGFPGLVLRVVRPGYQLVLLDALQKRIRFLREVCRKLEMPDVEVCHGRAEEFGRMKGRREFFDVAVARAVARLPVLAEYLLPFVRPGGWAVAWKGPEVEEEVREAEGAVRKLGGTVEGVFRYALPGDRGRRSLVVLRKTAPTPPEYPRRPGVPEKRPLG
ncbi:MAG: 16S rRNA (guanine(527)-N(7))-methyltransferase RsmG [Alicyclobacillaceae bacterium]|nr:16S rRNA (guanine(527)-N(7))-methyltransferase RsmG [Alicyclobacillaceae bacterium]